MAGTSSDLLLYILAIFVPPVPVAMKRGCGGQVCLNIVLWIIIWIPAVIHAFYIIASTPDLETYEAVNIPSHYQNHPGPGHHNNPPPPAAVHNQSFQGNGPPPPPPVGGQGRQEWDTPMHGQAQAQAPAQGGFQNPAYVGTHPQQQPQSYGAVAEPPSYHKS